MRPPAKIPSEGGGRFDHIAAVLAGRKKAPEASGEIRFVGDLQRLELKPGDRFVLTVDRPVSGEMAAKLREAWARFVGDDREDLKLLILGSGMKLGAIATDKAT